MTIKDPTRSNRHKPNVTVQNVNGAAHEGHLRSLVTKRSLVVGGHKTSVSLEDAFWIELRSIAHNLGVHLSQLVGSIDSERQHSNLSSAIRLFVLDHYRQASGAGVHETRAAGSARPVMSALHAE